MIGEYIQLNGMNFKVVGMFEIANDHWVYCEKDEVEDYKKVLAKKKSTN